MQILNSVGWALAALAAMGVVYQGVLVFAIWRFFAPRGGAAPATPADWPAVSLLKPLHGDEPHLADNLLGFLAQDYAGAVQMVCGVNHPGDAAAAVARGLIAAHPDAHIALSTGPAPRCANGKVGNLVAMMPLARHDILILSDSDMVVTPDYLRVVTQALRQPGVGAVSCAFTGRGDAGFWSRLGAAMVSFQATPNVILAAHFGLERPCMGATIAIRRAKENIGHMVKIEVEVDTLEQLRDALTGQPDIVLLDNMTVPQLDLAIAIRNQLSPGVLLEASGGVNLDTIGPISRTGIDRISIGALTHSAPALDLGFDWGR